MYIASHAWEAFQKVAHDIPNLTAFCPDRQAIEIDALARPSPTLSHPAKALEALVLEFSLAVSSDVQRGQISSSLFREFVRLREHSIDNV